MAITESTILPESPWLCCRPAAYWHRMLPRTALVVLAALVPALFADDLPPGVLLLSRIKRHVREDLGRLPDYTYLQTAQRYHGPADKPAAQSRDVVRLEVLYAGDKEMYGAPG